MYRIKKRSHFNLFILTYCHVLRTILLMSKFTEAMKAIGYWKPPMTPVETKWFMLTSHRCKPDRKWNRSKHIMHFNAYSGKSPQSTPMQPRNTGNAASSMVWGTSWIGQSTFGHKTGNSSHVHFRYRRNHRVASFASSDGLGSRDKDAEKIFYFIYLLSIYKLIDLVIYGLRLGFRQWLFFSRTKHKFRWNWASFFAEGCSFDTHAKRANPLSRWVVAI